MGEEDMMLGVRLVVCRRCVWCSFRLDSVDCGSVAERSSKRQDSRAVSSAGGENSKEGNPEIFALKESERYYKWLARWIYRARQRRFAN